MTPPLDAAGYASRLAGTLKSSAAQRHVVRDAPWSQGWTGDGHAFAFDVELCDLDDLPAGYVARVVVTVSPA